MAELLSQRSNKSKQDIKENVNSSTNLLKIDMLNNDDSQIPSHLKSEIIKDKNSENTNNTFEEFGDSMKRRQMSFNFSKQISLAAAVGERNTVKKHSKKKDLLDDGNLSDDDELIIKRKSKGKKNLAVKVNEKIKKKEYLSSFAKEINKNSSVGSGLLTKLSSGLKTQDINYINSSPKKLSIKKSFNFVPSKSELNIEFGEQFEENAKRIEKFKEKQKANFENLNNNIYTSDSNNIVLKHKTKKSTIKEDDNENKHVNLSRDSRKSVRSINSRSKKSENSNNLRRNTIHRSTNSKKSFSNIKKSIEGDQINMNWLQQIKLRVELANKRNLLLKQKRSIKKEKTLEEEEETVQNIQEKKVEELYDHEKKIIEKKKTIKIIKKEMQEKNKPNKRRTYDIEAVVLGIDKSDRFKTIQDSDINEAINETKK